MDFNTVADHVKGVPYLSRHQGQLLYDHVRRAQPRLILELGTAHGVSSAYMAAALEENGVGKVVTVDMRSARFMDPTPEALLEGAGLAHLVSIDRSYSTYTWFLKEEIAANSDAAGNCEPKYDFCFIDGAKNWTVDGLAVVLVERLLRENGWLLLDDLNWVYAQKLAKGSSDGWDLSQLSEPELREPHLRAVFDLIVRPHPSFSEFLIQDEWWAWARKGPSAKRQLEIEVTRSWKSYLVGAARQARRGLAGRARVRR